MTNSVYTTITRQTGLIHEMQSVAHNIANLATTGYRGEGVTFAEHVKALGDGQGSLSMASGTVRRIDLSQGPLRPTGGTFDFAIEGDGFFLVETPRGERLTRAGTFTPNGNGELATPDGHRLLDGGGAPIFVPPDAGEVTLAADGTLSAGNRALARIGLFGPVDPAGLSREGGTLLASAAGIEPVEGAAILQGHVEASNVDPVFEMARMIEVQRAYELGQGFMEREDDRIREAVRLLGQ